jgi:hypothetical protein
VGRFMPEFHWRREPNDELCEELIKQKAPFLRAPLKVKTRQKFIYLPYAAVPGGRVKLIQLQNISQRRCLCLVTFYHQYIQSMNWLLINYFAVGLTEEYYCYMNDAPNILSASLQVAVNGLQYRYSIRDTELCNPLETVMATLKEYSLSGSAGDQFTLYKTTEGNWYDIKASESPFKHAIAVALKTAIDQQEKLTGI